MKEDGALTASACLEKIRVPALKMEDVSETSPRGEPLNAL